MELKSISCYEKYAVLSIICNVSEQCFFINVDETIIRQIPYTYIFVFLKLDRGHRAPFCLSVY
jgi:hypothetical protein